MKNLRRTAVAAGLLSLASHVSAQVATACPGSSTDVCFKLNIPESTASSGTGDIFFQISAPSSYNWVALGQGNSMSGANIFVVYTAGDGNVTLSPRLGTGHVEPDFNGDAQVTLLEGSGVSNGKMVANVKCSSCSSWSGGQASFSGDTGNWIYAFKSSGGSIDSTSQSAAIDEHDDQATFQWKYADAKGGSSVNPLLSNAAPSGTVTASCVPRPASVTAGGSGAAASATPASTSVKNDEENDDRYGSGKGRPSQWNSAWGSAWPSASPTGRPWEHDKRQEINYCDDNSNSNAGFTPIGSSSGSQSTLSKRLIAHGTLAGLAFVIFFPVGAIAIRLASFTGVVWFHAAFQAFAYLIYIVAFGLGISIANEYELLNKSHPIIGIVVFVALFFQPILGWLHHSYFKKHQTRTYWSHAHIWLGRIAITLGIINGGLGFQLADRMHMSSKSGVIAYAVIAGVVWLAWVAAMFIGERRRSRAVVKATDAPPKYAESSGAETSQNSGVAHSPNGHYAPK